jgi:hypothetical protein
VVAVTVAALALTASAASAGTLTVSIEGVGLVTGSGIECERTLKDKEPQGTCSVPVVGREFCDPLTNVCTAAVRAKTGGGFGFDGWSGGCTGDDPRLCSVVVPEKGTVNVTASFRDNEAPTVALVKPGVGPVAGPMSLEATADDNVRVARVDFRVRGIVVATDTTAPFAAILDTKTIGEGSAAVTATAVDGEDLSTTTAPVDVTVDNSLPSLTVNGPNNQSFLGGTTQSWTIAAGDNGSGLLHVRCSLNGASFDPCSGGNAGHSVTNRPEGAYRLTVRATDNAGNIRDVIRDFRIDTTAPETTITAGVGEGASTTETTVSWALAAGEPGVTFECRVHPAALTPGAFAPCSGAASHTATGFAPGTYTFEARATDAAGNVEPTTVKRTFTVIDAPAPPPPGAPAAAGPAPVVAATTPPAAKLPAPQIVVTLGFNFNSSKQTTKLSTLVVKNVPTGSTVTATCRKGCAKKSFVKRNASGQVSLASLIKKKKLKVNTAIKVVVSKPGSSSAVKILKIRARKAPSVTTQCQPEGVAKPQTC